MTLEQIDLYKKAFVDKSRIFFIEHFLKTYDATTEGEHEFILFPRQKAFLQSLASYRNTIAIKPRQAGITTTTAAWATAQIAFSSKEHPETVLCIANKLDLSQLFLVRVKTFLDGIPRWIWGDKYYDPDPTNPKNKKSIYVKQNKSQIELFNGSVVYARSSGKDASRGVSAASILVFDEAAFIEDGVKVYGSAVATTSSVKNARTIMISTPNGKDELYYSTYKQALAHENGFNTVEFKWFQDPRYNKNLMWYKPNEVSHKKEYYKEKTIDASGSIEYNEAHWKKMEEDGWKPISKWYTDMCKSFNNNEIMIAQELDVSFLGSANNVVPPEIIEMQRNLNVREPLETLKDPTIPETWFWKAPIAGHRYIMSIDCSRGDAADRTAIEITDEDGIDENGMPIIEQVMEYHGKKPGDEIGELAFKYGMLYNEAYTVIDCVGGVGDPCALKMRSLGYKNLYYDDGTLKDYTQDNLEYMSIQSTSGKLPGFHSSSVRFQMLSKFATMLKENAYKIRSQRVINELETWVFKESTGRMDHMKGMHDDTITCLAMGMFVMEYSINKQLELKDSNISMLQAFTTSRELNNNNTQSESPSMFYELPSRGNEGNDDNNPFLWLFTKKNK
jgi:hypothetical protein